MDPRTVALVLVLAARVALEEALRAAATDWMVVLESLAINA